MKADESVKWERMWGLCVMQDSEIILEYIIHVIWDKFYK